MSARDEVEREVLRRAAKVPIMRTHSMSKYGEPRPLFAFEDGARLPPGVADITIEKMIADGRLVEIAGEKLLDDAPAQRYRPAS